MVVPAMAQPEESCECMFAPKAGQWQFDLLFGKDQAFSNSSLNYLLPAQDGTTQYPLGFNLGSEYYTEGTPIYYNFGSLTQNNAANMIGVQAKYFITNRWDINLTAAYNVNFQPKKDFVEGESYFQVADIEAVLNLLGSDVDDFVGDINYGATTIGELIGGLTSEDLEKLNHKLSLGGYSPINKVGDVAAQKAIVATISHSLFTQLGVNYHFALKNPRIDTYLGIVGQYKLARIEANYPYTGEYVYDPATQTTEDINNFRPSYRAGQLNGIAGGLTWGISYALSEGLILGFEVNPVLYQYTLLHMQLQGSTPYYAKNHNIAAFRFPQLKLGIRF